MHILAGMLLSALVVFCGTGVRNWFRRVLPLFVRKTLAVLGGTLLIAILVLVVAILLPTINPATMGGKDLVVTCLLAAVALVAGGVLALRTAYNALMVRHLYLAAERERRARFYLEAGQ